MRLSWNEIRARAADFAREWADASYEKGQTQTFYNEFFEVFGLKRRTVGRYEEAVKKLSGGQGFIDLFWPGTLIVEQKSAGKKLDGADAQALEYFDAVKPEEQPRYILSCDFQTWRLTDLAEREIVEFALKDLPKHVQAFGFMIGVKTHRFEDQDPVNIEAAELVGTLHDLLEASGYTGHDLERFLVRIVFCLFADDTGVFQPKDIFLNWLIDRTREDGSDIGPLLQKMFQTLDTPEDARSANLDEDMAQFPYINGDLFAETIRIPDFDAEMREALIEASTFDWSPISPAIFGALFQSVMDAKERRATGAHYTTEKNIMKVIRPLFLDGLEAELEKAKGLNRGKARALQRFLDTLAGLTFFDPACGCGNFLVIAYREIRRLELEALKAHEGTKDIKNLQLDARLLSNVNVDQFYGIEIGEFPARIAETAMWMMDHIMNVELSLAFGQNFARIPLEVSAKIVHGDALGVEWADVLPPEQCSYVFGNPPFIGQSYQSKAHRKQMARVIDAENGKAGSLDYVAAWFIKASAYSGEGGANPPHIAFVSTNSITQGEQVAQLWPILFDRYKMEISFAHRTFEWGSDARGKAHVHVVIVGLSRRENVPEVKRLFSYDDIKGEPVETQHAWLSPYLISADGLSGRHLTIKKRRRPIDSQPTPRMGTKAVEGGNLIFDQDQRASFIEREPESEAYFRPFVGSREFIQGRARYILHLDDASPNLLQQMPEARKRLHAVSEMRAASRKAATRALSKFPTKFEVETIPSEPFIVVPEVSSERREYVPAGWMKPPTIPSNLVHVIEDGDMFDFAIIVSAMHMAWLRSVAGRLKSDYRYSISVVYNTFPWPDLDDAAKAKLTDTGQSILDARAEWPEATLADLYDPDTMPANLRRAHQANDRAVDRLYKKNGFDSERERVEHLFALYEKLTAPVLDAAKPKRKKRNRKTVETG